MNKVGKDTGTLIHNPNHLSKCPDCGIEHTMSMYEHNLVCEARTCDSCLNNYPDPIPVDESREMGERICADCKKELDEGAADRDSEEEDEPEEESNGTP